MNVTGAGVLLPIPLRLLDPDPGVIDLACSYSAPIETRWTSKLC